MKDSISARSHSPDDRRTFESVLDTAKKKVSERSYNAAIEDCKLAMTILRSRPPSMAIQHSMSECLECMADAYSAQQQHETALTKYEEAFQLRGQVFQRVEKPMMELLFKLERTLGMLLNSSYVEKFNETENRWKAFVLNPAPGALESRVVGESVIPGQNVEELQELWKRVSRKQKSDVRVANIMNRLSMPALLIPAVILVVLAIAIPLCMTYIKTANDAAADKQNTVAATKEGGEDDNETATSTTTGNTSTAGSGSQGATASVSTPGNSSSSSTNNASTGTSGSTATSGSATPSTAPSDMAAWYAALKTGQVPEKEFATADKYLSLKISDDEQVHLHNGTLPALDCAYVTDGGSVTDWFKLFEKSAFHKCYWLTLTKFGLIDGGGTNFFDTSTPEFSTVQQMTRLAIAGKDFGGMRNIGGNNVSFKSLVGKSVNDAINGLKPELSKKSANSIVCISMQDPKSRRKVTVWQVGLDHNKNLLPAGRGGRNIVTNADVDYSKQVFPDFDTVIITDASLQQTRFRAVYVLSILAAIFLALCIASRSRMVRSVGVLLMIASIIFAVLALSNTLQSIGVQKLVH
ncbi:MAG TPA: hypothetical protein V6C97_30755 [Oculatellaceae cyanobacterium]